MGSTQGIVQGRLPETAARSGTRRSGLWDRRLTGGVLLALCSAILVARSAAFDFFSDDAFITLRYVTNLLAGHGLVFNPGERVEGYTNLLHLLLIAGLAALRFDPVLVSRAIGLVAALALLALVGLCTARLVPDRRWLWGGLAAAPLALNPYYAMWSLSGLETTLFALLVLAALCALFAAAPPERRFLWASVLAAAAALTRPEGVAIYPLLCTVHATSAEKPPAAQLRGMIPGIALWVSIVGASELWRYSYYGEWLPNTFYAKSGFTGNHVARGMRYLTLFSRNLWVAPAAVLAAAGIILGGRPGRSFGALTGLLLAVVVALGGDGLPAYRFMVPILAPLFALSALGAAALFQRARSRAPGAALALVSLTVLPLILTAWHAREDLYYQLYRGHLQEVPRWSLVGARLRALLPAGTKLALVPIGAVGFYSNLPIIDIAGLTDRHIARVSRPDLGSGWAGHEKTDGSYVLDRAPDLLLLGNVNLFPLPLHEPRYFFPPYISDSVFSRERDILLDPRFEKLYHLTSLKIQEGMYLNCYARN